MLKLLLGLSPPFQLNYLPVVAAYCILMFSAPFHWILFTIYDCFPVFIFLFLFVLKDKLSDNQNLDGNVDRIKAAILL